MLPGVLLARLGQLGFGGSQTHLACGELFKVVIELLPGTFDLRGAVLVTALRALKVGNGLFG